MKKGIAAIGITAALALTAANGIRAEPITSLAQSYVESEASPVLMSTTAYIHGEVCSHGDRARKGIAAIAPEWYGAAVVVYEAVKGADGYEVGDLICVLEGLDTGYGKSTGDGVRSKVRPDRASRGTIEAGKTVDVFCESREDAVEWMEKTKGKVMVQIIREVEG